MFNFLLVGPIQDNLILDICINGQIFILQLQNVIVDMFNKNMSLWSVKISICPFYLLLPFFFPSYLVFINIKSCYVSASFKNTSVIFIQNIFLYICFLGQYNYNKIHGCGQMNKQCVFESEFIVRILVWSMLIQCLFLLFLSFFPVT